jgi:hypothetical protein
MSSLFSALQKVTQDTTIVPEPKVETPQKIVTKPVLETIVESFDEVTVPAQLQDQKILQNSKELILPAYKASKTHEIFQVKDKEVHMIKSMRMLESIVIQLKDYCHDLGKITGKNIKEQDVIALALTEFFENNKL